MFCDAGTDTHDDAEKNSGLTDIYLCFAMPARILMAMRSRYEFMLRLPGKRQQPPAWLRAMEAPAHDVEDESESESESEAESSAEESGSEVVVGSYGSDAAGRSVLELLGQPQEGAEHRYPTHSAECSG